MITHWNTFSFYAVLTGEGQAGVRGAEGEAGAGCGPGAHLAWNHQGGEPGDPANQLFSWWWTVAVFVTAT